MENLNSQAIITAVTVLNLANAVTAILLTEETIGNELTWDGPKLKQLVQIPQTIKRVLLPQASENREWL